MRNLLSPRGGSSSVVDVESGGGPLRKDRRTERNSPYSTAPRKEKKEVSPVKCSFYPNCSRDDCPFFHPCEPCPDGDQCKKGKHCLFIHNLAAATVCKFADHCTNPHCSFSHPSPASIALARASKMAQIACKYFPACLNHQCPFLHDPALLVSLPTAVSPVEITLTDVAPAPPTQEQLLHIVCRFDPHCTRYGCYYVHPSRTQQSVISKSWTNPNLNAERKFVSNDATESM